MGETDVASASAAVRPADALTDMSAADAVTSGPRPVATIETPAMPRAAALGDAQRPAWLAAPGVAEPHVDNAKPIEAERVAAASPAAAKELRRPTRFVLLAASVALAAGVGAAAGSLGPRGFDRLLGHGQIAASRGDARDEIRALKETIAQLRSQVRTLNDGLAAIRTSVNAANATTNTQLARITDALDRAEHPKVEHHAAAPAAQGDITGTVPAPASQPKAAAKPAIVEGWVVRKVYDGTALVEGRDGIVEVEPGMELPGLGTIQDIRRQDGRWVVVTARGLIVPLR